MVGIFGGGSALTHYPVPDLEAAPPPQAPTASSVPTLLQTIQTNGIRSSWRLSMRLTVLMPRAQTLKAQPCIHEELHPRGTLLLLDHWCCPAS